MKFKKELLIATIILCMVPLYATTVTWTASVSTDWNTAGNWDTGEVPTSSDDVVIPNVLGVLQDPIIASGEVQEINNLTIESGAAVFIGPRSGSTGATLKVNGDVDNEGSIRMQDDSSFALMGSYSGSGSFSNSRTVYGDLSYSVYSIPFSDGSLALLNGVFSYEYNNESGEFDALPFSTATTAGKGYFVSLSGGSSSFTLGFGGTPIDEDVDIAITQGTSDDFNLVGNPYTAAISVSDFLANSNNATNTTGVVYLWDDGGANTGSERLGDYITVNSMGTVGTDDLGDGTSGIKGESVFNGNITTMQGFFVEAAANGNVSFTQDMQVTGNNADANFYRVVENRTKLKLSLVKDGIAKSTLIGFDENATFGEDYGLDAKKFRVEETFSIYSMRDEIAYAIQALPTLQTEHVIIPLAIDIPEEGEYQLFVNELLNLPTNYSVYLRDEVSGLSYNLSEEMTINFASSITSSESRFTLSFEPEIVAGTNEPLNGKLVLLSGSQTELNLSYPESEGQVTVYDLNGRKVIDQNVSFTDGQATIKTSLAENTMYVLKVNEEAIKFSIVK